MGNLSARTRNGETFLGARPSSFNASNSHAVVAVRKKFSVSIQLSKVIDNIDDFQTVILTIFNLFFIKKIVDVFVNQQAFSPASLVGYSFNYDGANRLKSADFGLWVQNMGGTWNWYPTSDYDVKKLVYLPNGNLDTLQRNNQYGILSDNLKDNYANNNNNMLHIYQWFNFIYLHL